MNAPALPDEVIWASEVAARLRLLQGTCAETNAAVREEYFFEEINRALKEAPPSKRSTYIQALQKQFPEWNHSAPRPASPAAAAGRADTPEMLVEKLVEAWGSLPEADRQALVQRLRAAGIAPAPAPARSGALPEAEVQALVGAGKGSSFQPDRALRSLGLLMDFQQKLEKASWDTWRELGSRTVRRDNLAETKTLVEDYITASNEVSEAQVRQSMEKNRTLLAAMLYAMTRVGREFGVEFFEKMAPEIIEEIVTMEPGAKGLFGGNLETKCWRKYRKLSEEYSNPDAVDRKVKDALVRLTEQLILPTR